MLTCFTDQGELELYCTLVASYTRVHACIHKHRLGIDHQGIDYTKRGADGSFWITVTSRIALTPLWNKSAQKKVIPFATKMMFIYVHSFLMSCVTTEMVILPLLGKLLFRKTAGEEGKQVVEEGNMRVGWWLVFNAIPTIQQLNRL